MCKYFTDIISFNSLLLSAGYENPPTGFLGIYNQQEEQ